MPNLAIAEKVIEAISGLENAQDYIGALSLLAPTDKIENRPLLAKYINQYTARNTCDYFIHKDLSGFLKRELDFYLKNEVMHLDDIENADVPAVENYLEKLKVIRKIATQLIDFLAQLENFQKKLWLKKKFITETNYCITLDRVPEALYEEIAANDAQREEWVTLFAIDKIKVDGSPAYSVPLTTDFLKANDKLVLDTAFFSSDFKARLIASIEDFDEQCDGLLIHSENFQALNLLQERYREQVKCVYIDPPYNTGDDGFAYKDNYKSSSWLTLMKDRIQLGIPMLAKSGNFFASIDDRELTSFTCLLSNYLSKPKVISVKMSEASGLKMSSVKSQGLIPKYKEYLLASNNRNNKGFFFESIQKDKWDDEYNKFMEGIDKKTLDEIFLDGVVLDINRLDEINNILKTIKLISVNEAFEKYNDAKSTLDKWRKDNAWRIVRTAASSSVFKLAKDNRIQQNVFGVISSRDKLLYLVDGSFNNSSKAPRVQILFASENLSNHPGDFWDDISTTGLEAEGGIDFKNGKKPLKLLKRIFQKNLANNDYMIDFFAGSGSSANAIIDLNKELSRKTNYIQVEMGEYFIEKLLPRVKLAVNNNKVSQTVKYICLESYEDTLNNLVFDENPVRNQAIESHPLLKEDYMLRYLLDVETRGSQSLLNIDAFADPTSYSLVVKKPGSDEQVIQNIDLIETFNYLLGLRLEHMDAPQTFTASFTRKPDPELPEDQHTKLVVDGKIQIAADGKWWFRKLEGWVPADPMNPNNGQKEKVLIVWRKLTGNLEEDNLMLDEWFRKYRISSRESAEFDVIYVNGSNNLPNLKKDEERWKVRLIEEDFHKLMWAVEGEA